MKRKKLFTHHYSIKTVCPKCRLVLWNGKDISRHEESCGIVERRGVTEIINQTGANERVIIHRK